MSLALIISYLTNIAKFTFIFSMNFNYKYFGSFMIMEC